MYTKCGICERKCTKLTSKCRCSGFYCGKHKCNHNCTFDYNEDYQKTAKKEHQSIVATKIIKINSN